MIEKLIYIALNILKELLIRLIIIFITTTLVKKQSRLILTTINIVILPISISLKVVISYNNMRIPLLIYNITFSTIKIVTKIYMYFITSWYDYC